MSREIRFRFWDIKKREFVTAHYVNINGNGRISYAFGKSVGGDGFNGEYFILQQFTGLKDKNGKEIFEGDVVKLCFAYEGLGVVEYHPACFYLKIDSPEPYQILNKFCDEDFQGEIIGNIFENEDLLNVN